MQERMDKKLTAALLRRQTATTHVQPALQPIRKRRILKRVLCEQGRP
jgi:hypothetical protein